MNILQKVFNYGSSEVRTVLSGNDVWFVAKDICQVLGIKNHSDAISRLSIKQKSVLGISDPHGRVQKTTVINEPAIYKLVFRSNKPEAEKFSDWVTEEVLPSIRQHGAYMTNQTLEKALMEPDFLIQLATNLKNEQQSRQLAETKLEKQQPLVRFAEKCMAAETSLLVRELAKLCCKNGITTGEKRLWQQLRDWGLVFKNKNEPKQEYVDRGYFEISQGVKESSKGSFTWLTMRITPKGQAYIIERLHKEKVRKEVSVI